MAGVTDDLPSTIIEAGASLRARRISSVELTQALLDRASKAQDSVSAYVTLCHDSALATARQADAELAAGTDRGPLHGVPLAIKDILATVEAPSTASSRVLEPDWGKNQDATAVARLRSAGAIVLGKTVLHEFAIGWPDPSNGVRFARNPWDLARAPGGSSSGTGAAIAAGLAPGGLGTDTGGSIRGPASFCGISGLKPTYGRVSKYGCVPLSYSLDHIGPMARTARDCAVMLQVLAGADVLDTSTVNEPVPDYAAALTGDMRGVRIGIPREYFFDVPELDAEVRDAVLGAVERLRGAGASVKDVELPLAGDARHAQRAIMLGEAYAFHAADLRSRPELYGQFTRRQILQGALYSAADYVDAQRFRTLVKADAARAMAEVDVLLTPTSLSVAPTFAGYDPESMRRSPSFMSVWNMTGQPAASICCGFSAEGLPIGLQIVGKPFEEGMVLRVADAYQQVTDWHTRRATGVWEVQPA